MSSSNVAPQPFAGEHGASARVDLLNLSGPYGVGKDTLIQAVLDRYGERVHRVTTLTTRPSSPSSDPSYTSVSPAEFAEATDSPGWIVNRQMSGAVAYATNLGEIDIASAKGQLSVHSIYAGDAGAGEIRRRLGSRLLSVAVLATSASIEEQLEILRDRLISRGREGPSEIERRLKHQLDPISYILANPKIVTHDGHVQSSFDRILVNSDLNQAISEVLSMAAAAYGDRANG